MKNLNEKFQGSKLEIIEVVGVEGLSLYYGDDYLIYFNEKGDVVKDLEGIIEVVGVEGLELLCEGSINYNEGNVDGVSVDFDGVNVFDMFLGNWMRIESCLCMMMMS